jgi:hypothetical protein
VFNQFASGQFLTGHFAFDHFRAGGTVPPARADIDGCSTFASGKAVTGACESETGAGVML